MRRTILVVILLCVSLCANAQFAVFDPTNLTQNIINSTNQIVEASTTAQNMISTFTETKKIYQQGKAYYDKLQAVNDYVREARKVQQSILMLGEISEMYIKSFDLMLQDKNFTPQELSSIAFGYTKLLQESTYAVMELKNIINPSGMSMTDKERLDIVDKIYGTLVKYRSLTYYYTNKNVSVSLLRSHDANNRKRTIALYGSKTDKYW